MLLFSVCRSLIAAFVMFLPIFIPTFAHAQSCDTNFADQTRYAAGIDPISVTLGDLDGDGDGDGDLDMAVAIYSSDDLSVQFNQRDRSLCLADFNHDGALNFFDISEFIAAMSSQDPEADFNDDGRFNFFDISAFLVAFAAGCP